MRKSTHWRTLNSLDKPVRYSIPEVRGLHLWVRADLKKYWIFRFTFAKRRYDMSLGSFPAVSLSDAKVKSLGYRSQLFKGENPSANKRFETTSNVLTTHHITFAKFSTEYIQKMSPMWTSSGSEVEWQSTLTNYAFPVIGKFEFE
jgi:hypothetical protein